MTVLEDKRGYLSGPIEMNSDLDWRIEPKKVLKNEFKINIFDPFEDPKQNKVPELLKAREERDFPTLVRIARGFVRKDLTEVDHSHVVIAYLPYKVATCGTHHEIINSNNAKKPTLLVADGNKALIPLWYYGFIPPEFMFDNWDGLYEYLREVNEKKHLSNNRWNIVYGLV